VQAPAHGPLGLLYDRRGSPTSPHSGHRNQARATGSQQHPVGCPAEPQRMRNTGTRPPPRPPTTCRQPTPS
jgi:hypothetical protein